ncbi:MAG TPA: hypothetical protein VGR73_21715 [Bryobacteraceae bacterium]|nr:hypothetical protein [Bryobacteraceae bacterium]
MNRRLVILDVVLLLFAGGLAWMLRAHYLEARARESALLNHKVPPKAVLAPPSPSPARPAQPAEYVEVAKKMLFSKDRNPDVVVEAPKPVPEPPMPALPIYHGQMDLGDPVAFLSLPTRAADQRGYHAGDRIGDFTLVAFDEDKIELEWRGKKVERKPDDLAPKEPPPAPPAGAPGGGRATPAAAQGARPVPASNAAPQQPAASAVTELGPAPATGTPGSAASAEPKGLGAEIGEGVRGCLPGDQSPAGTVLSGYTKRSIPSMFGPVCRWELAK